MPTFGSTGSILDCDDAFKDDWTPDDLPERKDELTEIHHTLEPASRGFTPNNMFVYGPAGQGKTVATQLKLQELSQFLENSEEQLSTYYVNCADLSSSYQVAGEVLKEISPDFDSRPRGHGLSNIFDWMFDRIEKIGGTVVIVLDEIDVIGNDDKVLYKLSRAKSNGEIENTRLSIVGISNNFDFYSDLTARVKDQLCEEEIRFAPYNANQLQNILERRAESGLQDGVLEGGVIQLCAAHAAKKDGSARQAINLLYKAAKIAHNGQDDTVTTDHVDQAQKKLNRDMLLEGLKDLTVQEYTTVLAVASLEARGDTPARTKTVYSEYKSICQTTGIDISTMRSIRDHLQALKLYRFLEGEKKTGGANGGERWLFELGVDLENMLAIEADDRFGEILDTIEMRKKANA
ncbi:AAA family ATPase [Haloarcula sp. CBA1131]|uniref:ORC1-type DNA replication protein n=1 Tax=Haloarcula rubripromontorii TaxID=1705562 RepID=A0A847UAL8_9EURY|nr:MULTISPECIES: AAA family ATPase [Haloarcula]KAA9400614.1 AAA family ATPase [Haloarcula sp. CBA1131]NLV08148.1 AAA family ATPase [Haloarcula rubripromontorii]